MRSKVFAIFLLSLLGAAPAPANWAWIRTSSLGDRWDIDQGIGDVTISKGKISGTFYSDVRRVLKLHDIHGKISFGPATGERIEARITAKIATYPSDYGDASPYTGSYIRERQPEFHRVTEYVVLSDGYNSFGFSRATPYP